MQLTSAQLVAFGEDGFLCLLGLFDEDAIAEVRAILDPLFARFDQLPTGSTRDITTLLPSAVAARPRSPEIIRAVRLAPRLASTVVYRTCGRLAEELIGRHASYSFDHAIYKQPFNEAASPWHQDQAYTGHRASLGTVHLWIPLQDATEENGCMHFIRGSHRLGLLSHGPPVENSSSETVHGAVPGIEEAVVCPMRMGGVTVHTPFTLHYTGPNKTGDVRRAWILHFGPWGRLAKLRPRILLERMRRKVAQR